MALAVIVVLGAAGGFLIWRFTGSGALGGTVSGNAAVSGASAAAMARQYPFVASSVDYNGNGVDDYTDILHGAQADSTAAPVYDAGYYQGGYPPDGRGACTDVVWRAFREAGYDLKAMVDADVAADPAFYKQAAPNPDPNIDFRRTGVLDVFFAKYGQALTTDTKDYGAWQAGDIVVFEQNRHIGVISDKRDESGTAFVNHNMGQPDRENDYLAFPDHMTVTGHYRWDASKIPQNVLKAWR